VVCQCVTVGELKCRTCPITPAMAVLEGAIRSALRRLAGAWRSGGLAELLQAQRQLKLGRACMQPTASGALCPPGE
jgi:hypothetical protein